MSKQLSTLIIDDEPFAREVVKVYLSKHPYIHIKGECSNGLDALNTIQTTKPDLIFIDIQMPELNGFEVLQELPVQERPLTIFTTAFDNFALQAFNQHAIDYLLKPFDQARFDDALNKALHYWQGRTREHAGEVVDKLISAYHALNNQSKK